MAVAAEVAVAVAGAAVQYSFHSRVNSAQYSKAHGFVGPKAFRFDKL
jgi:hypothetical protein